MNMITTMERTVQAQPDGHIHLDVQAPIEWKNDEVLVVFIHPQRIGDLQNLTQTDPAARIPAYLAEKPFDRSHPLPIPPDIETWEERFDRLGIGPDDWKKARGCARGSKFNSEVLFAERQREAELEETKFLRMFHRESSLI
jgi:hypothetical protein